MLPVSVGSSVHTITLQLPFLVLLLLKPQVAAAPAAPAAPMEADDPRHAWAAQNNVALQQRAQAEASKKVEVLAKAKEYLEKVNKVGCDSKRGLNGRPRAQHKSTHQA